MKFLERALDNQNQIWKYIVITLAVWVGAQFIGTMPLAITAVVQKIKNGDNFTPTENILDFSAWGISQNVGLLLLIIPFIVGLCFLIPGIKLLHKRTLSETINGRKKIRWRRCFTGAAVWVALMSIYLAVDYFLAPDDFVIQFELSKFIPLLLISLFLIPLQTSLEEIFFRGYFSQGVAARTKSRWLAILIPGIIFGLIHSMNPEVKEFGFWISMSQYIGFGLVFGLISVLDDGIELALGIHAANNAFLSLFVTHKASALQTPAVFEALNMDPYKDSLVTILLFVIAVIIYALLYKWDFSLLNKKVVTNENEI